MSKENLAKEQSQESVVDGHMAVIDAGPEGEVN
jgi:hypothetical protein